jgi:hypothetical protein
MLFRRASAAGAVLAALFSGACMVPGDVRQLALSAATVVEGAPEIYDCLRKLASDQRGLQPPLVIALSGGGLSINGDAGIGTVTVVPTKLTSHLAHDFAILGPALRGTLHDEVRINPGASGRAVNTPFHAVLRVDIVGFQTQYKCDSESMDWSVVARVFGIDLSKSKAVCLNSLRLKSYLLDSAYATVNQAAATIEIDLATSESQGAAGVNVNVVSAGMKGVERRFTKIAPALEAAIALAVTQTLGLGLQIENYHTCSPALPNAWDRVERVKAAAVQEQEPDAGRSTVEPRSGEVTGVVTPRARAINVRRQPSMTAPVIYRIQAVTSAFFSCAGTNGTWVPIRLPENNIDGWISTAFSPCNKR